MRWVGRWLARLFLIVLWGAVPAALVVGWIYGNWVMWVGDFHLHKYAYGSNGDSAWNWLEIPTGVLDFLLVIGLAILILATADDWHRWMVRQAGWSSTQQNPRIGD